MSQLQIIKNYADNTVLTQAQLDAALNSISEFINVTQLNDDNLQEEGVGTSSLAPLSVTTEKIAASAVTTAKIADANVTMEKLAALVAEKLVPVGVPMLWTGTALNVPTGYLFCDGSAVSRTTYANLFAIMGTKFGQGNGSTTFNLPKPQGYGLRFTDNGVGNDPDAAGRTAMQAGGATGDNVGSVQDDTWAEEGQTHNHRFLDSTSGATADQVGNIAGAGVDVTSNAGAGDGFAHNPTAGGNAKVASTAVGGDCYTYPENIITPATSTETRMKNFGLNLIVKY